MHSARAVGPAMSQGKRWVPAFAGTTADFPVIPAEAGIHRFRLPEVHPYTASS
jgi:hypothetical protein